MAFLVKPGVIITMDYLQYRHSKNCLLCIDLKKGEIIIYKNNLIYITFIHVDFKNCNLLGQ